MGDALDRVWCHALGCASIEAPWPDVAMRRAEELGVFAQLEARRKASRPGVPCAHPLMWMRHVAGNAALRAESARVLEALDRAAMPWLWLKGPPLAVELYGAALARGSGDLDLLVRDQDVERAGQLLTTLGYRPVHSEAPERWRYHEWAWVHPARGMVVELHWRLTAPVVPGPSFAALYARRRVVLVDGFGAQVPGVADQLFGLATHFHQHVGFFKGLLDVAAWWDTHGARPALRCLESSRARGVGRIVRWPLLVLDALGVEGVEDVIGVYETPAPIERLFTALCVGWTRGVLAGDARLAGNAPAAMKTQEILRVEVALWQLARMLLLDAPEVRRAAMLHTVWPPPAAFAARRGAEAPSWRDRAAWLQHPLLLASKALQESRAAGFLKGKNG